VSVIFFFARLLVGFLNLFDLIELDMFFTLHNGGYLCVFWYFTYVMIQKFWYYSCRSSSNWLIRAFGGFGY